MKGYHNQPELTASVLADKYVVVQTAPAVRAALAEEFGKPIGTNAQGKMVAALRRLGFDKVFDTNFGADLTIMEEANEFLERVKNGGKLPMITSCSPGWVKFCEHYYPEFTDNMSTCKSPQQMQGAITKSYFAEKMGIDPKNIVSVSVMPCTAKKFEIGRDDQAGTGAFAQRLIEIFLRQIVPADTGTLDHASQLTGGHGVVQIGHAVGSLVGTADLELLRGFCHTVALRDALA